MPKLACAGLLTDRRSPSIWASVFPSRIPIIALFMQRSIVDIPENDSHPTYYIIPSTVIDKWLRDDFNA
jgi:hypothetical protein